MYQERVDTTWFRLWDRSLAAKDLDNCGSQLQLVHGIHPWTVEWALEPLGTLARANCDCESWKDLVSGLSPILAWVTSAGKLCTAFAPMTMAVRFGKHSWVRCGTEGRCVCASTLELLSRLCLGFTKGHSLAWVIRPCMDQYSKRSMSRWLLRR